MEFSLKFEQLTDDCLQEVLKYCDFRERVRFERINKRFGEVLASVWRQQRVLFCSTRSKRTINHAVNRCLHQDHEVRRSDIFVEKTRARASNQPNISRSIGFIFLGTDCYQILKRCSNLRALYWNLPEGEADLALHLHLTCSRIEHVFFCWDFMAPTAAGLRDFLVLLPENNIKCLKWSPDDKKDIERSLELCPKLDCLIVDERLTKSDAFVAKLPDLKQLIVVQGRPGSDWADQSRESQYFFTDNEKLIRDMGDFTVDVEDIEAIALSGKGLKLFSVWNFKQQGAWAKTTLKECYYTDEAFRLMAESLPALEAINVDFASNQLNFAHSLVHLKAISLGNCSDEEDVNPSLESFLIDCGYRLKSVVFYINMSIYCRLVGEHCPQLEQLVVKSYNRQEIDLDLFTPLKRLRKLTIEKAVAFGFNSLLNSCTKLRDIIVGKLSGISQGRVALEAYAERHPKRHICLSLAYDTDQRIVESLFPPLDPRDGNFWTTFEEFTDSDGFQPPFKVGVRGNYALKVAPVVRHSIRKGTTQMPAALLAQLMPH